MPVNFGPCCFCGQQIEKTTTDPCRVTVSVSEDDAKWQLWYCHGQCFPARLIELPEAPGFFEPHYF